MRDPNRVEEVLNEIKTIWEKYPDLRLMQLLLNVTGESTMVYYIEDNTLIDGLKKFYGELK